MCNVLNEKTGTRKERTALGLLLDLFTEFIDDKLTDFVGPASSLFQDTRRQGYTGGITSDKEYARTMKGERAKQVIERFEIVHGGQLPADRLDPYSPRC